MKLDKAINIFFIFTLLIIIFESLNSIYLVKSIDLYEEFISVNPVSYKEYISINLLEYFNVIIVFMMFSGNNYFLIKKTRKMKIDGMYKGVWTILILGMALQSVFLNGKQITIFAYFSVVVKIILVLSILFYKESEE